MGGGHPPYFQPSCSSSPHPRSQESPNPLLSARPAPVLGLLPGNCDNNRSRKEAGAEAGWWLIGEGVFTQHPPTPRLRKNRGVHVPGAALPPTPARQSSHQTRAGAPSLHTWGPGILSSSSWGREGSDRKRGAAGSLRFRGKQPALSWEGASPLLKAALSFSVATSLSHPLVP